MSGEYRRRLANEAVAVLLIGVLFVAILLAAWYSTPKSGARARSAEGRIIGFFPTNSRTQHILGSRIGVRIEIDGDRQHSVRAPVEAVVGCRIGSRARLTGIVLNDGDVRWEFVHRSCR